MRYLAVLFDLDGTLLDTLADLGDSMNAVLETHGFPVHDIPAYRYFVGDGMENLVRRSLPAGSSEEGKLVALCVAAMREEYADRWSVKTRPYPGVVELLEGLAARGIIRAVLSNKPHVFVDRMLSHYFGKASFDLAFGEQPAFAKKPDPGAALEISRRLGVSPGEFLYLGDTDTDMRTAHAAGMHAIGALWGFRTRKELMNAGAECVIDSPLGLLPLLSP